MNKLNYSTLRVLGRLLLCAFLTVGGVSTLQAQDGKVTLPLREITADEVFDAIREQTSYMIAVNQRRFDKSAKVRVVESPVAVKDVLAQLFAGTGMSYVQDGNFIIAPVALVVHKQIFGSSSGNVVDAGTRRVMPDVFIEVLGQNVNGNTDANGNFSLSRVPAGTHLLKFIVAGRSRYQEITVRANSKTEVDLSFSPDNLYDIIEQNGTIRIDGAPVMNPGSFAQYEEVAEPNKTYRLVETESENEPARRYLPKWAIKTNLLYWATTSPNVAVEFRMAEKWTLNTHLGYNSWKMRENSGLLHWKVQPEARYWFCRAFERNFIGIHALGGQFDFNDVSLPFTDKLKDVQYKGWAVGAGISYGHHFPLGKRWGLELSVGVGYVYLEYDKWDCQGCNNYRGNYKRHYFGPTEASVSLVFMIN